MASGSPRVGPGREPADAGLLPLRSAQGRWVVFAAVLGSAMALLDGTVVNVALRPLGLDLGASLAELQWVVNAYMLALAALILVGGSLGDRLGRRRVFMIGVAWFAVASALCGLAESASWLIVARGLQGVGGALLTPGSLAIIQSTLQPGDRPRAIGVWSAWSGVAAALGPLLGGWLVQAVSWRAVFWINLPVAAVILVLAARHVPETGGTVRAARARFDVPGAAIGALGLGVLTYGLIYADWVISVSGLAVLAAFVVVEARTRAPMVPLRVFRDRVFTTANLETFVVYGALGALMFLLILQLQVVSGFSPLEAGLATVPFTVLMLLFSARAGQLSAKIGPRIPMSLGPAVAAVGVWLLSHISTDASYVLDVLPGVVVFGAGLTLMVAPLTATVLAAVDDAHAGIASGINNAVARGASLLTVAALPALVGLAGDDYQRPDVFDRGFGQAMWWCIALLVAGAVIALVGLSGTGPPARRAESAPDSPHDPTSASDPNG